MSLVLDGVARCSSSALGAGGLAVLRGQLTVWDRGAGRFRCVVEERGGEVGVPRGAWRLLRALAPSEEAVGAAALGTVLEAVLAPRLRPYQEAAAAAMVRAVQGVVVAPCGSGKTVLALGAVAKAGRSALVLVHTYDLASQWEAQCKAVLGVRAGIIGGGLDGRGPVTIALMQALARWPESRVKALGAEFGVVIADECHHIPCESLQALLAHLRGRYRWGLTATPERADGLTALLHWTMGPEIHRITHEELIAEGHLIGARIEYVSTGWAVDVRALAEQVAERKAAEKYEETGSRKAAGRTHLWYTWDGEGKLPMWLWAAIYEQLANNGPRNQLLVDLIVRDLGAGHTVLVLAKFKAHCAALVEAVRARGHEAEVLTADRTRKQRMMLLARFRAGNLPCVVATTLGDEGLDVPRLDRVVLASPMRSPRAAEQRLGRLLRPSPDKGQPVLYDFVDALAAMRNQLTARRRTYRRILGSAAA